MQFEKRPIALMFANLKGNIGDYAILEAILRDLDHFYPGRTVKLFPHGHLPIDSARVNAFENKSGFKLVISTPVKVPDLPRGVGVLLRLGVWPPFQWLLVKYLSLSQRRLINELSECEFICFAGGDQWNGMRLGPAMFSTLCIATRLNKKIYSYPFSCNPAITQYNTASSLKKYFELMEHKIIVRDSISLGVISDLGVDVVSGSDCVYGLKRLFNVTGDCTPVIGKKIIISVTKAKGDSAADATAIIVQKLRNRFKLSEIEILSTCEIEDARELESSETLKGIHISYPTTWQEAVDRFRMASVVITNRLHALILSSMCEVVVLPVTNREKSKAFAVDAGLPLYCRDANAVSAEKVEASIHNKHEILKKLRAYSDARFHDAHSPF